MTDDESTYHGRMCGRNIDGSIKSQCSDSLICDDVVQQRGLRVRISFQAGKKKKKRLIVKRWKRQQRCIYLGVLQSEG